MIFVKPIAINRLSLLCRRNKMLRMRPSTNVCHGTMVKVPHPLGTWLVTKGSWDARSMPSRTYPVNLYTVPLVSPLHLRSTAPWGPKLKVLKILMIMNSRVVHWLFYCDKIAYEWLTSYLGVEDWHENEIVVELDA